jgi:membrane associated rhomboid family serine protease
MDDIQSLIKNAPVASFIFAVTLVTSIAALTDERVKEKFSLRPYRFVRMREYWTIITSGLIHAHVPHLAINMLTYYSFAFAMEGAFLMDEISRGGDDGGTLPYFIGHLKFFLVYVGALILSDLPTVARYKDLPHYSSLGASGAISGVVAGMVVFIPSISVFGGIPGFAFLGIYLVYSWWASRNSDDNINHEAHLWGAVAGIGLTFALFPHKVGQFWHHIQTFF